MAVNPPLTPPTWAPFGELWSKARLSQIQTALNTLDTAKANVTNCDCDPSNCCQSANPTPTCQTPICQVQCSTPCQGNQSSVCQSECTVTNQANQAVANQANQGYYNQVNQSAKNQGNQGRNNQSNQGPNNGQALNNCDCSG